MDRYSTTKHDKHGHGGNRGGSGDSVFFAENALVNQRLIQISFFHVASKKCVFFNGMITDFSDQFASQWNKENVYGRMDPMMTFQNTERTISLGWVVPSVTEDHARMNLHKFEHLSSLLYPTYRVDGNGPNAIRTMEAAPLIKVKFTNLIHGVASEAPNSPSARQGGLLCAISGFTFNPNIDMGFYNPKPGVIYPKEYSVDCQMTVLHEHALGWNSTSPSGWLSSRDKFPYGADKLTGHVSICAGKPGTDKSRTRKAGSRTNRNIAKANSAAALGGTISTRGVTIGGRSLPGGGSVGGRSVSGY